MPIFQQSVSEELYEWLMKERKRRGAENIQETIRRILEEARAKEEESHG